MGERALFRAEAVAFQRHNRQWGQVTILQPVPTAITTFFILIAVALVTAFLYFGSFARKETVDGYLRPASGTAKIFATLPGTIAAVHVKLDQIVKQGEPLLTIQTNQVAGDDKDVNVTMLQTLRSQQAALSRQIEAEQQRTESETTRLSQSCKSLERQISELHDQIDVQSSRIRLSSDFVDVANSLKSKGDMADIEVKRRELALMEQQQSLSALKQQLAERNSQLAQSQASLLELPTTMAQTILSLRSQLADTEQRIAEVDARRAYVIRSPTAGRVATLQATLGQAVDPHRLQLEIVPVTADLMAELYLPARAIGFIRNGQPVRILYDAFPYQNFGTYSGRITSISQTMLTAAEAGGPLTLREPAYDVTASLDRGDVEAYGRRIPLQPDMLLKADIILERRSLMRWFFGPLLSLQR